MDKKIRIEFLEKSEKYFGKAELPITFYFSDKYDNALKMKHSKSCSCLIGELAQVRKGKSVAYNINSISWAGAKRYTGFSLDIMPGFEYFLSHTVFRGTLKVKDIKGILRSLRKFRKTLCH